MHSKRILTITAKNNIAVYHRQSVTRSIMRYQIQLEKICKIKLKFYMLYNTNSMNLETLIHIITTSIMKQWLIAVGLLLHFNLFFVYL